MNQLKYLNDTHHYSHINFLQLEQTFTYYPLRLKITALLLAATTTLSTIINFHILLSKQHSPSHSQKSHRFPSWIYLHSLPEHIQPHSWYSPQLFSILSSSLKHQVQSMPLQFPRTSNHRHSSLSSKSLDNSKNPDAPFSPPFHLPCSRIRSGFSRCQPSEYRLPGGIPLYLYGVLYPRTDVHVPRSRWIVVMVGLRHWRRCGGTSATKRAP